MTSQFISFQQHGHIFFVEFLPEDSPETYKITMWNDSLLEKWRNKLQNTFGRICSKFFTAIPIISDTMNNLNLYRY